MKKQEHKHDCYTHECEHCGCLIKIPWKVKCSYENKGGGGDSYNTEHAVRHLENYCNETGRDSIIERLLEKSSK